MYNAVAGIVCICALLAVVAPPASAQTSTPQNQAQLVSASAQLALTPDSIVAFASREQGIAIVTRRDDYVLRMSRFDRMLRLKSTQPIAEQAYLDVLAANVLDWPDTDKARLEMLLPRLRAATRQYSLPLPSAVVLVKTTGKAEVGQAHTRANAIILPERNMDEDDDALLFLLAHELFHIMTRHDTNFRRRAYCLIGFRLGNEISLPASIAPLQITNPDASRHDSYIDLTHDGRKITVVPILLSRSAVFDPQIGTYLDDYWTLRLLMVTQDAPGESLRVVEHNGAPALLKLNQAEGFLEKVGKNTRYVIHAEEILAENFALLVTGTDVREPKRLDALRELLHAWQDRGESEGQQACNPPRSRN